MHINIEYKVMIRQCDWRATAKGQVLAVRYQSPVSNLCTVFEFGDDDYLTLALVSDRRKGIHGLRF